jgi:hypothetical protein
VSIEKIAPAQQGSRDRILVEVAISAPAQAVWHALRDRRQIAQWFGWGAAGADAEIEAIFFESAEVDESRGTIHFNGTDDRFEIFARDNGTVVRAVRRDSSGDERSDVYEEMTEGWILFVNQLRLAVEDHPNEQRRVFRLVGTNASESDISLISRLAQEAEDGTMILTTPNGEQVLPAYYRSNFQLGVRARFLGDGLIVIAQRPADDAKRGGGALTVTTYGLGEEEFNDVRAIWTKWWAQHLDAEEPSCS